MNAHDFGLSILISKVRLMGREGVLTKPGYLGGAVLAGDGTMPELKPPAVIRSRLASLGP